MPPGILSVRSVVANATHSARLKIHTVSAILRGSLFVSLHLRDANRFPRIPVPAGLFRRMVFPSYQSNFLQGESLNAPLHSFFPFASVQSAVGSARPVPRPSFCRPHGT